MASVSKHNTNTSSTHDIYIDRSCCKNMKEKTELPLSGPSQWQLRPHRDADDHNSTTLYLFLRHSATHSLFAINIPPLYTLSAAIDDHGSIKNDPELVLEFPREKGFPDRMSCAKLGSNFYFLGGQIRLSSIYYNEFKQSSTSNLVQIVGNFAYPRDVHFYSSITGKLGKVAPMNTGKLFPQTFVANGKLYVLGMFMEFEGFEKSMKLFEEYDPATNQWKVLDHTPLMALGRTGMCNVIKSKLFILQPYHPSSYLIYDFSKHQWISTPPPLDVQHSYFFSACRFVQDTLYGAFPITTLGPFEEDDEEDKDNQVLFKDPLVRMSVDSKQATHCPYIISGCEIRHLRGRHFCVLNVCPKYVDSKYLYDGDNDNANDNDDGGGSGNESDGSDYMRPFAIDDKSCIVNVSFYKETSSSNVKLLGKVIYTITTTFDNFGRLKDCHVLGPETEVSPGRPWLSSKRMRFRQRLKSREQGREKKRKRHMRKKNKKKIKINEGQEDKSNQTDILRAEKRKRCIMKKNKKKNKINEGEEDKSNQTNILDDEEKKRSSRRSKKMRGEA